jgi:hypothetical protein
MRKTQQKKKLAAMEKEYAELSLTAPNDPALAGLREKIATFKKRMSK